jgi:hypothetical protein
MSRFGDDKLYTGSTIFSKKDDWFYKSNHSNNTRFREKMNQLVKDNPELFVWRPKSLHDIEGEKFVFAIQPIHSQPYPLKKSPLILNS